MAGGAGTPCPTSGTNGTLYWMGTGTAALNESDLSGNILEQYVFFGGQRVARRDVSTNTVHYYFSDNLGTHTVVENATGTACEQDIDYYPYGGQENDYCPNVAQHYKFAGKERDAETCATGSCLDNFGARFDASSLARFMTPDWAEKPTAVPYAHFGNPQSLNLYSYVENNPTTLGDPDGHVPWGFGGGSSCPYATDEQCQGNKQQKWSQQWLANAQQVAQNTTLTTTLSDKGLKFIAKHEGFKGKEYSDIYGNTTIGYGHLVKPGEDFSNGISKKDALKLLSADTKDAVSFVNKHLDLYVSQNKFDALVDTAFNSPRAAGILINKVNNEEPLWGETFRNTLPHGYNSPPGLLRRRDDEADLYLAGQY